MSYHRKQSDFANYRGQAGATYHRKRHAGTPFRDKIIAKSRAQKIQPFVKETDVVLEYGVGVGYNLAALCCQKKIGYDVAEACRERVESKGINFTSDIDEVLKWQEQFDVVICHHVLEHVPNPLMELSRIRQLLKPTGHLILCVPFENTRMYRKFSPRDPHMHLFSWNVQSICNLLSYLSYEINVAKIRRFGYERKLAPLAKFGVWAYKAGLWIARLLRPFPDELFIVTSIKRKSSN